MKNAISHTKIPTDLHVDQSVSLEDQIARRAHELWQERGGQHGNDFTDWLQAEREISEWHQAQNSTKANSANRPKPIKGERRSRVEK
jgi:hypothetical protein